MRLRWWQGTLGEAFVVHHINRRMYALTMRWLALVVISAAMASVTVPLRTRVQMFKGSDEWREAQLEYAFDPKKTAIVICDMWDKHWCSGATQRVDAMVKRMEPVLQAARKA